MLEELVRDISNSVKKGSDEFVVGLHPSTNNVFKDDGLLENAVFWVPTKLDHALTSADNKLEEAQRNYAFKNQKIKRGAIGAVRIITNIVDYAQIIASNIAYNITEGAVRLSESAIRGTGRAVKYGASQVYERFDQDETSGFKEGINSLKERYQGLKDKVDGFLSKYRQRKREKIKKTGRNVLDHTIVGGIGYALIAAIVSLCGGEEPEQIQEPTPIVEPAREETQTRNNLRPVIGEPNEGVEIPDRPRTRELQRLQRYEPRTEPQQIPLDQLTNFGYDNVLAYCSDQEHVNYIIETLREQARIVRNLDSGFRMTISERNEITRIRFGDTTINVVRDGQTIPQVRGGYDVITLRGHIWDMPRLYNEASAFEADNSYYIVGGCRSDDQVTAHANANRAMSAGTGTENGVNNTDFLVEYLRFRNPNFCSSGNTGSRCRDFIERNSRQGRNSWDGYRSYMDSVAPINARRWILPGSTVYVRR